MSEKLTLLKQELESSFEQQKAKLEKEIKALRDSEKSLKEKLAAEIVKSLAVQQVLLVQSLIELRTRIPF